MLISLPSPQAKQSLATLTKDVPKRQSVAIPTDSVVNGSQEWVLHPDLPLTAAIRQSQHTLYQGHPVHTVERQGGSASHVHLVPGECSHK